MNRKKILNKLCCAAVATFMCGSVSAQSLAEAKKLYDEGKYAEAKPALEKLVKQSPNNPSYTLWYGICCYKTGDLENAEKNLKVSVKRKTPEAYKYLADVYYNEYKFEEAEDLLEEYITLLEKKKQDTAEPEAELDLVTNAKRMMDKVESVTIIDSLVVDKDDFLSAYKLSEESGSLKSFGQFFFSDEPIESSAYVNQKGDKVYYAKPTENNNYCLFTQSYLMDAWGDEKQLPMNVNTSADDNYPFVLSDGVTLYYSSKGNNSIGGYDLFVTRYNMNSDTYLAPEQLGMPFNSPFNDYMIVIDEAKNLGWFVSDRFQPDGKVCVYLFIPDANHPRLETDDVAEKRSRAKIESIKATMQQGVSYADLIELAHQEVPFGDQTIEKDFEFPLGNNTVYYTLDEIRNPKAREIYEKVVSLNKQLKNESEALNSMRIKYSASSTSEKANMKQSIISAEQNVDRLKDQVVQLEKKARNAEISYLSGKK
jgi:tetratricopeptide (TPR) repeat protein